MISVFGLGISYFSWYSPTGKLSVSYYLQPACLLKVLQNSSSKTFWPWSFIFFFSSVNNIFSFLKNCILEVTHWCIFIIENKKYGTMFPFRHSQILFFPGRKPLSMVWWERMESYYLVGSDFQFCKMRKVLEIDCDNMSYPIPCQKPSYFLSLWT